MELTIFLVIYAISVFVAWILFIRWNRDDIRNYETAFATGIVCLIFAVLWPVMAVLMGFASFVRYVARM